MSLSCSRQLQIRGTAGLTAIAQPPNHCRPIAEITTSSKRFKLGRMFQGETKLWLGMKRVHPTLLDSHAMTYRLSSAR